MAETQKSYKADLIEHSMSVNALKFGSFVLKSGRISPYFFNAGHLCTGPILATLSTAYATTISDAIANATFPEFDVLFGPAYKGIPFAATTALTLFTLHKISIGYAYDRKEAKDHGEGGNMVGADVKGKRVVILDDVMTSGKAIRGAIDTIIRQGGQVVGVVQALDREEVGQDGRSSTVIEIENLIGKGRVLSVLKMKDLMDWLDQKGLANDLQSMKDYRDQYGLK
ncbi:orotate phosphoribosyltransferase [Crepidotus variabilis]|uniref:orotate phosphoribosyltransferase n=1 Tax=Crepidotus variabilis TaxID=179855 RepID=A0A9P6EER1_9AGAR|nr:orotate phosphoribosyltransferase [Crepidotus variabilis]